MHGARMQTQSVLKALQNNDNEAVTTGSCSQLLPAAANNQDIGVTTGSDVGDMSPPDFGLEGTYNHMSPPDFGELVILYTQSMTHIKYEFDAMSSLSNNYK